MYLGDLLDEGSPAEDQEYSVYYRRFMDVFATTSDIKVCFHLQYSPSCHRKARLFLSMFLRQGLP